MSSTAPMMSVIIIVKNNEALLPRAIESVLAQTQNDLELIIVNDGSTDNTGSIIDSFQKQDPRVQPHHLDSNVGRSSARNIGLDASRGKYVTFLDADDYLPTTAIADLSNTSEEHRSDIVFARIKPFDNKTGNWLPHHYTDFFMRRELHGIKLQDNPDLLYNHSIVGRSFRRDFLNKHGIRFSTQRRNAEDVTFSFYSEYNAQRMSIIPEKTVYYYSVGNFLNTANKSKVEDARDSIIETLNFALHNGASSIINTMHKKSAIFAGNLGRAKEVYGMTKELRDFLPSLVPLVDRAPEEIIDTLAPYSQRFTRAIRAYDFDRAFYLFENKYRFDNRLPQNEKISSSETTLESADSRIKKLHIHNQRLAAKLNLLYNSTSWKLTRPLRAGINIYRRLTSKTT